MATSTSTTARCGCVHPRDCVDRRRGRYLTAVYRLTAGEPRRVRTGEVGEYLDVAPATVTETFDRLDADALADYEKYAGVRLTDRGEAIARELARRQCVVRAFFETELGVEVDSEAGYRVGYVLSGSGVDALFGLVEDAPDGYRDDENGRADGRLCEVGAD